MTRKQKQEALNVIAEQIRHCRTCKKDKVGLPVPGEGNANADFIFVGEAPGKQEAKTGRPFIGPAGKILRELITIAGLKEADVFITSPVKYLPKHVTPTSQEVAHGRKHLFDQLTVIQPKVVVLLGRVAALAVLQKDIQVSKEHGKVLRQNGQTYLFTYHPAAPLYAPKIKAEIIKDFKKLKKIVKK